MLWRAGVRAGVECISVGNSLLVERVLSQWTYDIKGKASFKDSTVGDGPMADFGAPGRIRTRDPLLRRQPLYPLSYWGIRIKSNHPASRGSSWGNRRRSPALWPPDHLHITVAALQLFQHLGQPLLLSFGALGAVNPTDVVVPLIGRAGQVSIHQPAFDQSVGHKFGHFMPWSFQGVHCIFLSPSCSQAPEFTRLLLNLR